MIMNLLEDTNTDDAGMLFSDGSSDDETSMNIFYTCMLYQNYIV